MDRNSIIIKYFHKANVLTTQNAEYSDLVKTFFEWLVKSDHIDQDKTTQSVFEKATLQKRIKAQISARNETVIAGLEEITFALNTLKNITHQTKTKDGDKAQKGDIVLELEGSVYDILSYERTILNILQRMSGVATATNQYVEKVKSLKLKSPPYILATRKTPFGMLDKKAVAVGGGLTHRLALSDGILIKDNHLVLFAKEHGQTQEKEIVAKVVETIFPKLSNDLAEIEVEQPESIYVAIEAFERLHTDNYLAILLDNFTPEKATETIRHVKNNYNVSHILFEASGGINFENIEEWAKSGVDVISIGALTHSARGADLSLDIVL